MGARNLLCSAKSMGNRWQALCLDFDIAVQGASFAEVQSSLNDAIFEHVEAAEQENEPARAALLNRRTPVWVKLSLGMGNLAHFVFGPKQGAALHASFEVPCGA
jgi:hypothetical protein